MRKIIALDIGGTNIKYCVLDQNYNFEFFAEKSTNKNEILKQVIEIVENIVVNDVQNVEAIVIATTGVVNSQDKEIIWTNDVFKNYQGTNFKILEEMFKIPVIIENDANAAAISEKILDKSIDNYAVVTLGTGVGIGIIKDNKLFKGMNYLGGELGYLKFDNQSLDKYLSFTNQNNLMRNYGVSISDSKNFDYKYKNNPEFKKMMDEYFEKVTSFCYQLAIFLNLDIIFLSGGFSYIDKNYFKIIQKNFNKEMSKTPFKTKLELSKSKNHAGMIGVAMLYFESANNENN